MPKSRVDELRALAARRRREGPIPNDLDPRTVATPNPLAALFAPPPTAAVTIDFDGLDYQRIDAPRWAFEAMRDLIRDRVQQADEQFGVEGNKAEWAMVLMALELRKTGWTSNIIETLVYWAIWGMHNEDAMRDIGVHDLEIIYRTRPEPNPNPDLDLDPNDCLIIDVETRRVVKH